MSVLAYLGKAIGLGSINSQNPSVEAYPFSKINSSHLVPLDNLVRRADFIKALANKQWSLQQVFIAKSDFVPSEYVQHVIRNKKSIALGVKYVPGDRITHMEGALHTFITPICIATLSGDPKYAGRHTVAPFENKGRKIILSAAVQPDFELPGKDEVLMKIVEIKDQALEGIPLAEDQAPLWTQFQDQAEFEQNLPSYEKALQQHMVYHLSSTHRLPALNEVIDSVLTDQDAKALTEGLIKDGDEGHPLVGRFVQLNGHTLSLEVLLNTYVQQLHNEFSVLERELTQGYVYTIDPPSIFAQQIEKDKGVFLLNRIQALAFKQLKRYMVFTHLKIIGFNNYLDVNCLELFKVVFPDKLVEPKSALYKEGYYAVKEPFALVMHNNSDGFGQNIETEGPTSLDGVIGTFSDAACQLTRSRPDLLDHVV